MTQSDQSIVVDIRPETDIFETYRRLSYKAWYAIAELVDNATWNYSLHRADLPRNDGAPGLEVDIFYARDEGELTVVDNAYGMEEEEFRRAMQLAKPPADISGRSEFGMGLKTAACWLGPRWTVVSSQYGSTREFSATVDVGLLKRERPTGLRVDVLGGVDPALHYTRVEIRGMREYDRVFVKRTLGKIKAEIASMYRRDLASGDVRITFNGEALDWHGPRLLVDAVGEPQVEWRRPIDFTIGSKRVSGWIGLLENGRATDAGLHLFRRDRLVYGGPSQGWKPWEIFKAPNSFMSQRLIGELDFDDWRITHTKDQIDWSGEEEKVLIERLEDESREYVAKARESRRTEGSVLTRAAVESLVEESREDLEENDQLASQLTIIEEGLLPQEMAGETAQVTALMEATGGAIDLRFGGVRYPLMRLTLSDTSVPSEPLVRLGFPADDQVCVVLNLQHPFVTGFVKADEGAMRVLSHILYVDAIAERIARKYRDVSPAQLRQIKDDLLRNLRGPRD